MTEPIIQIRNLDKTFKVWYERPSKLKGALTSVLKGSLQLGKIKEFDVLKDINLEVYPGDFLGVLGRNGSGKSTLFKILAGVYSPSRGTVKLNGRVLPLIELGAGFHPDLSGLENITLNASVLGFGRKAIASVIDEIVEFSELKDKIYIPVKYYSSGMHVRLGFAIASHLAGEIMLIDEVLAVGDMSFKEKCLNKIAELHKLGRTIILVTHASDMVEMLCNRCIVIEDQHKVYDGPPQEGVRVYKEIMVATQS